MIRPFTGLALAAGLLTAPAFAADLKIEVQGIASSTGQLRVALYRAEGFPHEEDALAVQALSITGPEMSVTFGDLTPGRYAVIAYHDEDGNGRMNRFLGMIPTEPYGLSNNPTLSGPPKFEQAAVSVEEPESVIEVRLVD